MTSSSSSVKRASYHRELFSKRGAFDLAPNALARGAAAKPPIWDLTASNPTLVGLAFEDDEVGRAMGAAYSSTCDPQPRGLASARRALGRELDWDPEHLVLTATTSDAYSFLIKLFCDPGDQILIPEPSYPLLSMLVRLEGGFAAPYRLQYDGEWHIDRAAFLEGFNPRIKLILGVSPNNPTGSFLCGEDLDFLLSFGLPVVLDEVFAAYDLRSGQALALRHTKAHSGLLFALGGLSKAAGLPQLKLSWLALSGDEENVERSLAQLDLITDTYLSANEITQRALPALLSTPSADRRRRIFERLQHNRESALALQEEVSEISVLPVQGGWYQVLRLPAVMSEEQWVLDFLDRGLLVQPGWFYDFPDQPWVVVSLVTPPQIFTEGLNQLKEAVFAARRRG
ncbi:MAG: pyridoxal phosphate-dependent aminotransferase [Polyangiales bacterium]